MHLTHLDTRILIVVGMALVGSCTAAFAMLGSASLVLGLPVCTVAVIAVTLDRYRGLIANHERQRTQIQALIDLSAVLRPRAPLPPMAGWACSPELAVAVVQEHLRGRPSTVVEIGSGVSTLVNGYLLERHDGYVWSLDHDLAFAETTRENLTCHGLEKVATVLDAELVDVKIDGQVWRWYDLTTLPRTLRIDLLVIDGPPTSTGPLARYPALPLLAFRLADDAVIILDDAARASERRVVERWCAEYPEELQHDFLPTLKGTSILRWRRHAPTSVDRKSSAVGSVRG